MKTRIYLLLIVFVVLEFSISLSWCEDARPRHAPNTLPDVEPEMLTPEYWIALQDDADRVIMTSQEIEQFNEKVRTKKVTFRDRFGKPDPMLNNFNLKKSFGLLMNPLLPLNLSDTVHGDSLRVWIKANIEWLYSRDFYDGRNAIYSENMKQELVDTIKREEIPAVITRRFGIIVHRADVRLYPTSTPGYSETKWEMDYFQTTGIYSGTPVAILYQSVDCDYLYVESPIARGWIATEDIAIAGREEIRSLTEDNDFIMATGDKIPVYGDPSFTNFSVYLYFSSKMSLIKSDRSGYIVKMAYRKPDGSLGVANGYIKPNADIHRGYLPYTKRNMLTQMFKLLNQPYGWADQFKKRDCSGTQRVLLKCFGIVTGRWPNFILLAPDHRVYIDPALTTEEKMRVVSEIEPVITFAGTGGHIVLYLGRAHNGKLYFFQQAGWGYKDENGENLIVNRTTVNSADHSWYNINGPRVFSTFRK
ncbi:SH3 domain-containing protein [Candidatus Latescibacterota bacterium]